MIRTLSVCASVSLVVVFSAMGCSSGGDDCGGKSPCSGDPPPTQAQIDQCKMSSANCDKDPKCSKCKSQSSAYASCLRSNIVCDSANKTDIVATGMKAGTACKTQADAVVACQM